MFQESNYMLFYLCNIFYRIMKIFSLILRWLHHYLLIIPLWLILQALAYFVNFTKWSKLNWTSTLSHFNVLTIIHFTIINFFSRNFFLHLGTNNTAIADGVIRVGCVGLYRESRRAIWMWVLQLYPFFGEFFGFLSLEIGREMKSNKIFNVCLQIIKVKSPHIVSFVCNTKKQKENQS